MPYKIVTDSSATLSRDIYREFELTILPLSYMVDDVQTVIDPFDENFDLVAFYDLMRAGKVVTTSLPNLADSTATLTKILDDGYDILYIGFDSAISGTSTATGALMDQLAEKYPERKLIHIDTLLAAGTEGLIVYYACCKKRDGATIEEAAQYVYDNMNKFSSWFTVEDLMYLFRGGRVSKTSAWAGTLLNIKPVLRIDEEGKLVPTEKVRGRKKSLNALVDHFVANHSEITPEYRCSINHGDCLEDALYVRDQIMEKCGLTEDQFFIDLLDPVIGAHTGPSLMGVFFPSNDRH